MSARYLKIVQPGWENFSGELGMIVFEDGMSVEPVPDILADRVATVVTMARLDDEGNEESYGITDRLAKKGNMEGIPVVDETVEVTDAELRREQARIAALAAKENTIYTRDQLEGIADMEGIKGLRKIGNFWGVHDRSIGRLIERIIEAQDSFLAEVKRAAKKQEGDNVDDEEIANNFQFANPYDQLESSNAGPPIGDIDDEIKGA